MIRSITQAAEIAGDAVLMGRMTTDQANVYIVQLMGVRVIRETVPRAVRTALNAAVKRGEIGHIKKEGLRPECYHHKNARANALDERDRIYHESRRAIAGVFAHEVDHAE